MSMATLERTGNLDIMAGQLPVLSSGYILQGEVWLSNRPTLSLSMFGFARPLGYSPVIEHRSAMDGSQFTRDITVSGAAGRAGLVRVVIGGEQDLWEDQGYDIKDLNGGVFILTPQDIAPGNPNLQTRIRVRHRTSSTLETASFAPHLVPSAEHASDVAYTMGRGLGLGCSEATSLANVTYEQAVRLNAV